jgi:hypothetical protein
VSFQFRVYWRSAELLTLTLGPSKPSADTLLDHGAFKLCKNPHHLKQGLAGRRRGVQALLMQEQVDAQCVQLGQEPNPPLAVPE